MQLRDALKYGSLDPLDRTVLLEKVLQRDRAWILAHPEYTLTPEEVLQFQTFVTRREQHEPLAYIIGEKEFFGLPFFVNEYTLIPRPETELMVEQAINAISKSKDQKSKRAAVIDIGTGSGCIIISLVKHFLDSRFMIHDSSLKFFATEISTKALSIAQKNAVRHGVAESITFLPSDLLENIREKLQSFDTLFVLANLPYLSETLYKNTEPTVQDFEPKTALLSGKDGLDHYRKLLRELKSLAPGKKISFWLEISPEQAVLFPEILERTHVQNWEILPDLAGKARVVFGTW